MSVRAPFCSLDMWPAGWTPEQFWKLVPFRESNPDIAVIKPIPRSLCLLKYSAYFCLKHKLYLTADIPFYFWIYSKGPPKSCRNVLLSSPCLPVSFTMRKVSLEDHPLSGVCDWFYNTFAATHHTCGPSTSSANEFSQHVTQLHYNHISFRFNTYVQADLQGVSTL